MIAGIRRRLGDGEDWADQCAGPLAALDTRVLADWVRVRHGGDRLSTT